VDERTQFIHTKLVIARYSISLIISKILYNN